MATMAASAETSSNQRYVSKLPHDGGEAGGGGLRPGTSQLKDLFFPPRKPHSDVPPAHSTDLSPRGEKAATAASTSGKHVIRKPSGIAMERCLRVIRPSGKSNHYFFQKEEEIRDGVLHLKPVFHTRQDALFVEFPTPETAKQVAFLILCAIWA